MGRWAVRILILLVLVWGGWWYLATTGLQNAVQSWLEDRRAAGWQAQTQSLARTGFPLAIGAQLEGLSLDDPATDTALRIPAVTVSSAVYWPGHATVRLSDDPVTLSTPANTLTVGSSGTGASLRLHPGTTLQLEALRGQSSALTLDLVEGRVLSVAQITADMQQMSDPATYDIDLLAEGVTLGSLLRQNLQMPVSFPDTLAPVVADMTVTFERPWDRSALEGAVPQPRMLQIDRINAQWADIALTLGAALDIAPDGRATGTLRVALSNWKKVFDMALASGQVPAQWAQAVEGILGAMARSDGTLDLKISVDRGRMRVGFIPLGELPPLILR